LTKKNEQAVGNVSHPVQRVLLKSLTGKRRFYPKNSVTAWVSALESVLRVQSQLKKDIPSNLIEKRQQLNPRKKISSSTASPAELEKTLITSCLLDTKWKVFGYVPVAFQS
jgi:hypothetical protein